jgi:hypothetical protein
MRNPVAFAISTLLVLSAAGFVVFFYGLPMLRESVEGCHFGGGTRSFGCSTSFGTLMTFLFAGVALALAGIWNRFGRY